MTRATGLWLLAHLAPSWVLTIQLDELSGIDNIRVLMLSSALPSLLLAGGQILLSAGTRLFWAAGLRRLDSYQEV